MTKKARILALFAGLLIGFIFIWASDGGGPILKMFIR